MSDGKHSYKLCGPPKIAWGNPFDKAMVLYLSCLDAFAQFLRTKAANDGTPMLPTYNVIDVDKGTVAGYSIHFSGMIGDPDVWNNCLLYTSPSPRDRTRSRMPSSA